MNKRGKGLFAERISLPGTELTETKIQISSNFISTKHLKELY